MNVLTTASYIICGKGLEMKITAHSGCDSTKENSIEFLEYALNTNVDCVEVDIRKNENELVLGHDEFSGVSLKQAFELLKQHPDKKMNCDLKSENLEESVYQCAIDAGVSEQLIYSGNVDIHKCSDGQKGFEKACVYFNIENVVENIYEEKKNSEDIETALLKIHRSGIKVVNIEYHFLRTYMISLMEQMHLKASVWTVNEKQDQQHFLQMDVVENMTTRQVKQALELEESCLRSSKA